VLFTQSCQKAKMIQTQIVEVKMIFGIKKNENYETNFKPYAFLYFYYCSFFL
jgi:hypothetical protein